jgi:hemolysin III
MAETETYSGEYTPREEKANAIIHAAGLLCLTAGATVLLVIVSLQGDAYNIVGTSIYGATLIFLYLSSVLYHASRSRRAKYFFQVIDHIAIFLLIAGSYTVFMFSPPLRGGWGWSLFGVVWGLAAAGIMLKAFFFGRFEALSIALYLMMGWVVVISLPFMLRHFPEGSFVWLLAGGISYTIGVVFYGAKRIRYNHAIWHVFVLGGSACHLVAAYYFLMKV